MLSSLALESVTMTRRLAKIIENSEIAKGLGKQINVKVVLSRIPRLEDASEAKTEYSRLFGVPEKQLFFLFSSPALEREEFLALLGTQKDQSLVQDYVRLFQ